MSQQSFLSIGHLVIPEVFQYLNDIRPLKELLRVLYRSLVNSLALVDLVPFIFELLGMSLVHPADLLADVHLPKPIEEQLLSLGENDLDQSFQVSLIPDEIDDIHLLLDLVVAGHESLVAMKALLEQPVRAWAPPKQVVDHRVAESVILALLLLTQRRDDLGNDPAGQTLLPETIKLAQIRLRFILCLLLYIALVIVESLHDMFDEYMIAE